MKKFATFIVNHTGWILLLFAALIVYSVWGMSKREIEYSITAYLPETTDTRIAIDIMDEEFTTHGSATLMVRNISYTKALALHDEIENLEGVKEFTFKNTEDYYKNSCALFNISYDGSDDDPVSVAAYEKTLELLKDYDCLVSVSLLDTYADDLQNDVNFVLILAVAIIVVVLIFTSESFAEVPVFLITFAVAAILNMGTNYLLGKISFISNSVCVVLQLALAIDYAIILSHRFTEEKEANGGNTKEALIDALAKALPEISGSSLTTISGLIALTTMALRLGADLGIVLAKSILCSMLSVFFFMPAILMLFSKAIDKTKHKSFVPSIRPIVKGTVKLRYVIPAIFLVVVTICTYFSFQVDYVYSSNSIDTDRPTSSMIAKREIEEIFGYSNTFVILMPVDNVDNQLAVLNMVEEHEEISSALGIANVELTLNKEKVYLAEKINYKRFSDLIGVDESVAGSVFENYAFFSKDTTKDGMEEVGIYLANKEIYTASLLDLCDCAFAHNDFIYALLYETPDALENYEDLRDTVQDAEAQLIGTNYSRLVFNLDMPSESKETFAFIELLLDEVKSAYPDAIFAGDSMSSYDLNQSFSTDNIKVSVLTIVFVFLILMISFRSWGLPIPLVIAIQGAIFINFSYYVFASLNVFFFVYLIVSAIQMGATIDYAIVTTTRYQFFKQTMNKKDAMVEAVNGAFPTIVTSGLIMIAASFLIGFVVGDPLIATLGLCLGRGVIISIICVMFVLPAFLIILDKPLSFTFFPEKKRRKRKTREEMLEEILRRLKKNAEIVQTTISEEDEYEKE